LKLAFVEICITLFVDLEVLPQPFGAVVYSSGSKISLLFNVETMDFLELLSTVTMISGSVVKLPRTMA
jgi:hypothetical protein